MLFRPRVGRQTAPATMRGAVGAFHRTPRRQADGHLAGILDAGAGPKG